MRLQTDPTVIYGLGERFDGNLTRSIFERKHPTIPTHQWSPADTNCLGRARCDWGCAHPKITGELYFVANGSGGHVFSRTLEAHNANVRKYQ